MNHLFFPLPVCIDLEAISLVKTDLSVEIRDKAQVLFGGWEVLSRIQMLNSHKIKLNMLEFKLFQSSLIPPPQSIARLIHF